MSARLSDSGIAKLSQRLKTDSQLYLSIGIGCQNMIEAERILMVHFNIHFLCASVWFRSGEVGVTQWERCSGSGAVGVGRRTLSSVRCEPLFNNRSIIKKYSTLISSTNVCCFPT